MPVTPLFGIPYPDGTTNYVPLQDHFAAIANGVEDALSTGLGGAPRIANSDSERNSIYPAPVQGNTVVRPDKGYTEGYYSLYNSGTNPGGAATPGWYPIAGKMPLLGRQRLSSSLQGILANSLTVLLLTTAITNDTPGISYNATNGNFTVDLPGNYLVTAAVNFQSAGSSNQRQIALIQLNGATYTESAGSTIASAPVTQNVTAMVNVPTGGSTIRLAALSAVANNMFGSCTVAYHSAP